jgi:hypothetical protein
MRKYFLIAVLLVIIGSLLASARAETLTIFDSNAIISDGDIYDTIVVKGNSTVVDMIGGDVNTVITMNASTFNVSDGNLGVSGHCILTYDSSILSLSGGTFYRILGYGQSEVYLSGNATQSNGESSLILDSASVTISGNAVSRFEIQGNGKAYITGGYTYVNVREGSPAIYISGGTVEDIVNHGGGAFYGTINVIGYNLIAIPYGGTHGGGEITGYWNDDTPLNINLGWGGYSLIKLYDGIIPVECSNRPESDLNEDCKVDFADFSKMAAEWLQSGAE